jgi:hypothetical protein
MSSQFVQHSRRCHQLRMVFNGAFIHVFFTR